MAIDRKTCLSLIILLGAAFSLGGCGLSAKRRLRLIHPVQKPVVKVIEVKPVEQTDDGASLVMTLELDNPNTAQLPLQRASYDVELGDGRRFSFNDRAFRTLSSQGQQQIVLTAAFAPPGNKINGQDYSVSGWVSFTPPGALRRLLTRSGLPLPRARFRSTGRLE